MDQQTNLESVGGGEGVVSASPTTNPQPATPKEQEVETKSGGDGPPPAIAAPAVSAEPLPSAPEAVPPPDVVTTKPVEQVVEIKSGGDGPPPADGAPVVSATPLPSAPEVIPPPDVVNAKPETTEEISTAREGELLQNITNLDQTTERAVTEGLRLQLKVKEEENEILKNRIKTLEAELLAVMAKPGSETQKMVETIKRQHEELLSRAKGMIFDKTKMVKNQELQIEALASQVASLKDVAGITKDLLEIRNTEVKHLESRLETMELRFKAEKERHQLVLGKIESGTKMNEDLKKEYETQLSLFKELRVKYEERVAALVSENKKLTESIAALPTAGISAPQPE